MYHYYRENFDKFLEYYATDARGQRDWKKQRCRQCQHQFPESPTYPVQTMGMTKATYDQLMEEYNTKQEAWSKEVGDHLSAHPVVKCPYCKAWFKKTALKAHQKTYSCTERQRQVTMEEQGYVNIEQDFRDLTGSIHLLSKLMLKSVATDNEAFDNEELINSVLQEAARTRKEFSKLANVKLAYTTYNPVNPNKNQDDPSQGWQLVHWAPAEIASAMKYLLKAWRAVPWNEQNESPLKLEAYTRMWEWLLADDDKRFAALGIWELAEAQ